MRRILLQQHQKYRLLLLLGDLLIIIGSFSLVLFFEEYENSYLILNVYKIVAICCIISIITTTTFYIFGLYDVDRPNGPVNILILICLSLWVTIIIYSALAYFIILLRPGKIFLILFLSMVIIFVFTWRILFNNFIKINKQNLLFIGKDPIFDDIFKIIKSNYSNYYSIKGHQHSQNSVQNMPVFLKFIEDEHINTVVYSVHSEMAKQISNDLITIQFRNKNIIDAYNFYQFLTFKYPVYFLDNFWLLINAQKEIFFPAIVNNLKRAFDVLWALLLLPPALPLLLISALAIRLDSGTPVLFIQERLGKNGVPFQLLKLRTMNNNSECQGPRWCVKNDPRITRVGKFLRKFRVDELPQLFNVLMGKMSIVGPRPVRSNITEDMVKDIPYYKMRLLVKPGLTGWAQIHYRHNQTEEGHSEMLQYDLFYIMHQSIGLDLLILFKTIKIILWGKGT